MSNKILVLNFGSTSSKVAVYDGLEEIAEESISHPVDELSKFDAVFDQTDYRKEYLLKFLEENDFDLKDFACIISRGGTWKPVPSGVFEIKENMVKDLEAGTWGFHASGLGCKIGLELAEEYDLPAITADSPNSDEYCDYARYSGIKQLERRSVLHALNHKAIGRRHAAEMNKEYEDLNLIIVHMGGGISVVAHKEGLMIDANSALDGDGPFTPERSGALPVGDLVRLCFSGDYTQEEVERLLVGEGGLMSYLDTNDGRVVEEMIDEGNEEALKVFEAMGYQIAKEIGAMASVLDGKVDGICFTGGLAYSDRLTSFIKEKIGWIADTYTYPGEMEMLALAENADRYLKGEGQILDYDKV